ncbi:MAG TPA: MFS transporter [Streptosporangiaceae bacterium]|jgi:MFS family permease|nr:MFS transporter [Streptosporangiaceae bacterium]
MAEQAADSLHVLPLALAEPTEPVTKGWIGSLGLASLVMWMASLTPLQILIPEQLQHIDNKGKILALGLVSASGAIASLLATPIAGAISDRTTHSYPVGHLRGRRHRWTLVMAILSAVSLALIAGQTTVVGVGILWVLFSAFQNGEYASLSAAIPDHVPVNQRATVAGWVGMPQALGLVLGTAVVVYLFNKNLVGGYLALAIPLVLLTLPFVLLTADHPLDPEHRAPLSVRTLLGSYWIDPRRYPDFAWAWITRFLASLAIGMGTLYLLYFLRDQVHYGHPAQGLFVLIAIYTGFVVVTAIVGGLISDRIGKRKMIVTVSGCLMGTAALLLTFVETWPAAMVAAVLFGTGFGAYLAVDQALITQVLPAARDRAKDLGIINIAIVGPAALAGAIAALLVSLGGYPALFAATAVVAAIGSVLVWKIKSVP